MDEVSGRWRITVEEAPVGSVWLWALYERDYWNPDRWLLRDYGRAPNARAAGGIARKLRRHIALRPLKQDVDPKSTKHYEAWLALKRQDPAYVPVHKRPRVKPVKPAKIKYQPVRPALPEIPEALAAGFSINDTPFWPFVRRGLRAKCGGCGQRAYDALCRPVSDAGSFPLHARFCLDCAVTMVRIGIARKPGLDALEPRHEQNENAEAAQDPGGA